MIPKLYDVSRKQYSERLRKLLELVGDKLCEVVFPDTLDGWRLEHQVGFALTNLEQFQLQQELAAGGWGCVVRCLSMDDDMVTIFIPL